MDTERKELSDGMKTGYLAAGNVEGRKDLSEIGVVKSGSVLFKGDDAQLSVMEKLRILTDAAKYDVACTSSGVERKGSGKGWEIRNLPVSAIAFRLTEGVYPC